LARVADLVGVLIVSSWPLYVVIPNPVACFWRTAVRDLLFGIRKPLGKIFPPWIATLD